VLRKRYAHIAGYYVSYVQIWQARGLSVHKTTLRHRGGAERKDRRMEDGGTATVLYGRIVRGVGRLHTPALLRLVTPQSTRLVVRPNVWNRPGGALAGGTRISYWGGAIGYPRSGGTARAHTRRPRHQGRCSDSTTRPRNTQPSMQAWGRSRLA
jgi:hypothetical protein